MRRRMTTRLTTLAAALAATVTAVVPTLAASAAASDWQDGTTVSDTILNCWTGQPTVGVSANTGWMSPTGEVPKVGEKFYLRGYIGLVGLPCSEKVLTVPEIIPPAGFHYPDEPVLWGINKMDEPGTLTAGDLAIEGGGHGGISLALPGDKPFVLKRGEVLEFQFPVVAEREFKGTGTRAPTCTSRRDGTAPCPVGESGDHLQIAFMVGGHGGDKQYVTPYVPLFAAKAGSGGGGGGGTAPRTTLTGGPANGAVATSRAATFTLGSSTPGSSMECTLDGRARNCAVGSHSVTGLKPGTHVFTARARSGGVADATPEKRTWTVPVPARSLKGWKLKKSAAAYEGQVRVAQRKGSTLTVSVRDAKRVSLVASTLPKGGKLKVYAGTRLLRTVSLAGPARSRKVIGVASLGKGWSGRLRLVTADNRQVRIEGVAAPTR